MTTQPKVRQFLVEELAAGWIPDEQRRELLERLASEGGADRLDEIARSNEAILKEYVPQVVAVQIAERCRSGRRPSRSVVRFALPAALAAVSAAIVLAWVFVPGGTRQAAAPKELRAGAEEHLVVKGAPQLIIHRQHGAGSERLDPGTMVAAGDRLQLEYNAAEARFGVVLSVDGRGGVALHYPARNGASTALEPGGARVLPFSYELDDAPGFERFFMVWSDAPIVVDTVLEAARKLGASRSSRLALPDGLDYAEYLLRKPTSGRRQ